MVTSVKGHPVNLDTFNASACFDEIQKLQKAGGVINGFRASLKAVELPWHSLRDAFAHGCELFTGVPHAYRDGQLKKHSWHFVRAVSSATYAAVALPLALAPGLSLKVADSLRLRDSWENKVSKGVVAGVKDTVVAMGKGRMAKSALKFSVGLAAFGALAWLAGNFNTPVAVPDVVTPPPVPPNMFGGFSMPNLGDYNLNPLLEVTSQASKNLDPKAALGTVAAAVATVVVVGLLGKAMCCGSKKTKPLNVERLDPPQHSHVVLDAEGDNANQVDIIPQEQQEVQADPGEPQLTFGRQNYAIRNGMVTTEKGSFNFHPATVVQSIFIDHQPVPITRYDDGTMWICTADGYKQVLQSDVQKVTVDGAKYEVFSAPYISVDGWPHPVYHPAEDEFGHIWLNGVWEHVPHDDFGNYFRLTEVEVNSQS